MKNVNNKKDELLNKYGQMVFESNQNFNLTGHKTLALIQENLIASVIDSFVAIDLNELDVKKIIDVGSGSGIPGIVLAILFPECEITLVESNAKKCNFLANVVNELKLNNVKIINSRVEELDNALTEAFDLGVSRAVSSIAVMNELLSRFIKQQKYILHLKSRNFQSEVDFANNHLLTLGLQMHSCKRVETDNPEQVAVNVIYQKISKTPKGFPRSWKIIKKNLID